MTGEWKRYILLVVVASALLVGSNAWPSSWDINYKNLTQVRQGRNDDSQAPINQYVGFGLTELPRNSTFQTDFRGYVDAANQDDQAFDLYQAVFHIEPVEYFNIDGGRQLLSDGFDSVLLDGVRLGFFPSSGHIGGSVYAGIPRYLEQGNFHNVTEGLYVGANLNLLNVKDTAAQFSLLWRKVDATQNNNKENDTVYAGLASSHQFSNAKWTPNVYGDVEADIAGKTLDAGTLGIDLYPHWRVALTFEGSYFNVNRNSNEATIFGSYLSDEMFQGRQSAQIKLVKNLHFIEDVSYQRYSVPGLGSKNGYVLSAGLDHYCPPGKTSSTGQYYFRKSFGGTVNGALLEFVSKYFNEFIADLSFDVSHYSKITNQNGTATSLVGSLGYQIAKRAFLSLGGEYNHNNWFDHEGRVTVDLELGLDSANYTPEKRSKNINRKFHEI